MSCSSSFVENVAAKRLLTAPSVAQFKFAKSRVRLIHGLEVLPNTPGEDKHKSGGMLYWMMRDQRVQDNWAFLYAQRLALKFEVPLSVCFVLVPCYQADTLRHFSFMVDGLAEVEQECRSLNIPFYLINTVGTMTREESSLGVSRRWSSDPSGKNSEQLFGGPQVAQGIKNLVEKLNIACIVTDFSPLRTQLAWTESLLQTLPAHIPVCQIDAHNIVPVWCGSNKLEYTARTIRPKLFEQTARFLTEFPPVVSHPFSNTAVSTLELTDWEAIKSDYWGDRNVGPVSWAIPGTTAGFGVLRSFIDERLKDFDSHRNNPDSPALSCLSPWFHFGQLAPQRAILEVSAVQKKYGRSADVFFEEAFNRRELADNYCFYNPHYDSFQGVREWAKDTLMKHAEDKREVAYTKSQLEEAQTADDLWNAAQRQLLDEGKMHGFLRQYWAKKILEWCADGPEVAIDWAIYFNDRYSLDGTDPNGYVGIMWAICGVHDQGWPERKIFGKVRYMCYNGCKKWFSVPNFVSKYLK
ncbi:unnamed protein product [Calicophoron daubneyi]|uniref:Deoxyribodipyrimidine photo-lyase n=2 Tax=Calicophoron daubneyi TaxID=300641 RepID=A0AAV2TRY4_CALDB